ncbi:MAG: mannitol dehydrogenase family protein [Hyphomicrobiales bacterium]
MIRLSNATLHELPAFVLSPSYERSKLKPGIVHIGLGNFHRAHQAWYLHRLMQEGEALDWAIVGAGVRPYDEKQRLKLKQQDYLTTLLELDPDKTSAEVIGSMIDYVPITEGNTSLIAQMADPAIRIVAMTVTEGGYYLNPVTKGFDECHADIRHDVEYPDKPCTAFGAIVAALKIRRESGALPFTCLSCDNLQGNGAILKQAVVSLAELSDPDLAKWIETHSTFPNSMVDCIVPATGEHELELAKELGIEDLVPVSHENFRQWVIEDDFCAGRPDWDKVGATFTDDVHDHEKMKLRLLNGGHQLIANAAEILGVQTISDAIAHEPISHFLSKVVREEIAPHVMPVGDMTPELYLKLIIERFSNFRIIDTTRRVAFDGSSRHTGFVLPSIRDGISSKQSVSGLALAEAAWARMCAGTREGGTIIEPNDPFWDDLNVHAKQARERPLAWLEMTNIYGDLKDAAPFAEAFEKWLSLIWSEGMEAALKAYVEGS